MNSPRKKPHHHPSHGIEAQDLISPLEMGDIVLLKNLTKKVGKSLLELKNQHPKIAYHTLLQSAIDYVIKNNSSYRKYWNTAFSGYLASIYRNLEEFHKKNKPDPIFSQNSNENVYLLKKLNEYRIDKLKKLPKKIDDYSRMGKGERVPEVLDETGKHVPAVAIAVSGDLTHILKDSDVLQDPEQEVLNLNRMSESEAEKNELLRLLELHQSQGILITKKLVLQLAKERDFELSDQEIFDIIKKLNS